MTQPTSIYRALGQTGMHVSRFGLGTMVLGAWGNTDLAECKRIINQALDAGINLVDTADMYGDGQNEEIVGDAIATRRDEVVLCTKFHHPLGDHGDPNRRGNSRRWIMNAVDDSLRRLNVDHIDLYQAHRPDPATDIGETVAALNDLIAAGKIRAWGTSTFPASDLVQAHWSAERLGKAGPHTEQPPYSIFARSAEHEVLPTAQRLGMGVMVWSPLSGGWLTGKYNSGAAPAGSRGQSNPDHFDGDNPHKATAASALADVASQAGHSLTHMALAWATEHPAVTSALIGPRTESQLDDLLAGIDLELDADTLDAIDAIVAPGTDLNPADKGWESPGLAPSQRRRPRF